MNVKKPNANVTEACKKAPKLHNAFGPILDPYLLTIGAVIKADKLAMPNTKPNWRREK